MKKFYAVVSLLTFVFLFTSTTIYAQQVPNPSFEDWNGEKFDGEIQPKDWFGSNISQAGINFNLTNQEAGHTGQYSIMVKDTEVGALGITELSPGYFSLGKPWSWLKGIDTNTATAGTSGGINWTHRPDSMSVWIKRIGDNVDKEDFYLLYYAWSGTAKSSKYKAKDGGCASVSQTNEESDIRLALDANECGTDQKANQIAEGMWREKNKYGDWTNIRVPIYYFNDDVPEMMNIIFSASNYPNFRAKDGLYDGNALYVDDVELIYASKIDKLYINKREWKAFDPNSSEEQVYSVGKATEIPAVYGVRGAGAITNARGTTATFPGRRLTDSEFQILQQGSIDGDPMIIQVTATDNSSTSTYKIKFVSAASNNARLADIQVNGTNITGFNAYLNTYNVPLPYGTTEVPIVTATAQDNGSTVTITQATSTTGTATILVTAADGTTITYTLNFSVAQLSDNTLEAIYIDGELLPNFSSTKNNYTISLPLGTTETPVITWKSAYEEGAQTIILVKNTLDEGAHITVSAPAAQTTRTYKLTYKIEASSYAYLAGIMLNGQPLDGFTPEQTNYTITLPIGTTTLPAITWEQGDPYQQVAITEGGINGTTRIVVTAAAGNTVTYRLTFSTDKSSNNALQGIALDGTPLEGFHPDTLNYTITLPAGTTELPAVTYTQGDEYQTISLNTSTSTHTVRIAVKAGDGTSRVYVLTFEFEKSANALLQMIYLNGDSLEGFTPDQLTYIIALEEENIPDITVAQNPSQNVNITQPAGFGTAHIVVQPEVGTPVEYTIIFTSASEPAIPDFATDSFPLSSDVSLSAIYINGELYQQNPTPQTYTYELPWRTAQVPSVVPVAGALGQTITVTSQGLNQTTTIHVLAEDGITAADYAIAFPVVKSSNTQLELIEIDGFTFDYDPATREYIISLPYGTSALPAITFTKAEEEQEVELCTAGLSLPATLKVTAEDGIQATYTLTFQVEYAPYENTLQSIIVDHVGALDLTTGASHSVTLPYGTTDLQITYIKQYPEQSVTIVNGGVSAPTTITVKADDPAKVDMIYTITPNVITYPEYSLTGVKVNGVELANFDPNVFTYIIPVTEKPTLEYQHAATVTASELQDNAKFTQVEVTDETEARLYTFYYYYQNDVIPNGDFNDYRAGLKNTSHEQMPVGWYGYADQYESFTAFAWKVDNPGKEFKCENGILGVSWGYWSALKGSAPLVLTLGSTEGFKYANNSGSSATFSGGIPFRNTPDAADITYQLVDDEGLQSKFSFVFTDNQNQAETTDFIASQVTSDYVTHRQPLTNNGKVIQQLNINIDASNGHLAGTDVAGTFTNYINYGDVIYIDRIAFAYSSALAALTVNDQPATLNGNEFTATLSDSEVLLPTLGFTGEVSDQQQVVAWADDWTVSGATATRTATITNYAEDLSSTTYTLTVTRPVSNNTTCTYTVDGEDLTVVKGSPYQTISVQREATRYAITATAEDGSTATYYAEIPPLSIDADPYCTTTPAEPFQYAPSNATLDNVMVENGILVYEVTSPLDTVIVAVTDTAYHIDVYGEAGKNHYCVSRQASDNALLSAIYIDGVLLEEFYESTFTYQLTAPELPEVTATAADPNALVQTSLLRQDDTHYVFFIQVTAPDGFTQQGYTVAINIRTLRSTALLHDIRANNQSISGFSSTIYSYNITLPTGVDMPTFKAITADGATVETTVAEQGRITTITYTVTSEDGTGTSTYTVMVEQEQSSICTLEAIYLDGTPLDGFDPNVFSYDDIVLPYGTTQLPEVTATTTDPAATFRIEVDSARLRATITVTAENNAQKVYILHFTIAKNTDATLSGIFADGTRIADFDAMTYDYTLGIPFGAALPTITATPTDPKATVVITPEDDMHYTIVVTAEDEETTLTYTVTLVQLPSTNSNLLNIFVDGNPLEGFSPTDYEYTVVLPYGAPLPEVTYQVADSEQVVAVEWTEQSVLLTVMAGDNQTTSEYQITFTHELSDNNYLLSITLNGEPLSTFHRDSLAYTIHYPVGTDSTELFTAEDVVAIAEDASATVTVTEQGTTLVIIVTAANGDIRAYSIEQLIALSNDARLSMIYLDSLAIEGFDPDIYEYTVKLPQGALLPVVTATPMDSVYAEVELGMEQLLEDGSKLIEVDGVAQDGTRLTYSVYFTFANWSPSADAVVGDCLFFPVQGARNTFRAVTISLGVKCAIYNLSGQLLTIMDVPVLDVNSVEVITNDKGEQVIKEGSVPNDALGVDYVSRSGEPFVYMFYNVNTKRIGRGGKFISF